MKNAIKNWQIYWLCRRNHESRQRLFNHLWNQYQKRLTFFIQNMIKENAEDLFQEVMIKVFQNLNTYNPVYSFNTWIYTIVRNHCVNYLKKRKLLTVNLEAETLNDLTLPRPNSPEAKTLNKEFYQTIDNTLNTLNENNRQIAFLHFFEGMKNREISQIIDIPIGTVKSRLHSIRKTLKKELEKYHEN